MTLAISIRIPDGVVIAVDSLSTVTGNMRLMAEFGFKCSKCNHDNKLPNVELPPMAFPVSTKSSAQKLVQFKRKFGIACYGNSFVNRKSMYSQIRSLEANSKLSPDAIDVDGVAELFLDHFTKELTQEAGNLNKIPEKAFPFGFQVVGFDKNGIGKTWAVSIGRNPNKKAEEKIGLTMSGDTALLRKLLEPSPNMPAPLPNFMSFSLQDAVDYSKFLIGFVADYQRFANMIPTVGGDIDVALVTNYSGLRWIEQKRISKILDDPLQEN
jgi:hypothetical protein